MNRKNGFTRWATKSALAVVMAGIWLGQGNLSAQTLTVSTSGGTTEKAYREIVYDPYTAETKQAVDRVNLVSEEALAKMIGEEKRPTIDLYQFTGGQELVAKKRGLTQDVGDLGGAKIAPMFRDPDNQWVAVGAIPSGIVYNTKYIKTPPKSLKDFLKPEFKGKVGLPNFNNVKGIDFMVMLARAFGGSEANPAPGMAKLKELIDGGAVFYGTAAQMKTFFAQETMWITFYDSSNAMSAIKDGLPVAFVAPEEGMSLQLFTNAIAKNSTNAKSARAMIARSLLPESQAKLAATLGWYVLNPDTKLPPAMQGQLLAGEDVKSFVVLDRDLMGEKKAEWIDQFNRMIGR